ncbi:MAG: hypothetical protein CSA07_00180 [Bacteroidia bacterium]|nr:MAG: hypothetical protein CSA07_00180 [Bacteroidia bacterium]
MRRSQCLEAPQRDLLRFWLRAHSRAGHGVHSPLLYGFCRALFCRATRGLRPQESARLAVRLLREGGGRDVRLYHGHHADGRLWDEWCGLNADGGWVTVDLYVYGLAFRREQIPPHHLLLRPPLRWLLR